MKIHKEGYLSILLVFLFVLALNMITVYTFGINIYTVSLIIVSLIFWAFIIRFFRHPVRVVDTPNEKYIYAPADGKVVVIEKTVEKEYFNDTKIQVSIFMSPFDIHINWFPIKGIIKYFKYHKGRHLVAWHPKSSEDNERTSVVIKTNNGIEILMRQIAGAVARRIVYYTKLNDEVEQGQELGFIKFGSRVDLFLPLDSEIIVGLNDKTVGTKTLIAKLK